MIGAQTSAHLLLLLAATAWACGKKTAPIPGAVERRAVEIEIESFRAWWLEPARVAPPAVNEGAVHARGAAARGRVSPLRAEDASWNQWPGDEYRLFNNRAAYLFEVTLGADGPMRWDPERSWLRLNGDETQLAAARQPDEVLLPLMQAALDQERWVLEGDLVQRTRAAGPFRSAYLPVSWGEDEISGLVAFPAPDAARHVISMELGIAVQTPQGVDVIVWRLN